MQETELEVLYEDNHLLAVNKPANLATMGTAAGETSLVTTAKSYLKRKYGKPGNVYLGVVSRLDAVVSGVVILARTSKAAGRLAQQFRQQDVDKTYQALIAGTLRSSSGECVDWIRKNERERRMSICSKQHPAAKEARLAYHVLAHNPRFDHLQVKLLTGRKHQIRVQLAHRGHPILGDRKYGSQQKFPRGIALHSHRLQFDHPVRHHTIELVAPIPSYWPVDEPSSS